jgi:hypothetical protein
MVKAPIVFRGLESEKLIVFFKDVTFSLNLVNHGFAACNGKICSSESSNLSYLKN